MRVWTGTSGFSYKEWRGSFYPEDLPDREMLGHYATRLSAVEVNNTFYRMPRRNVVEGWAAQVPEEFRFVIKASRRITHMARLHDTDETLAYLWQSATVLGDRLGPILFQLPPFFRNDATHLERLKSFCAGLPDGCRAVFEFRHASWVDDAVHAVLRDAGCALCTADSSEDRAPELIPTTDWGYLRLRREDYGDGELRRWAERIAAQPWREAFVFFKHEDAARAPQFAARLPELMPASEE